MIRILGVLAGLAVLVSVIVAFDPKEIGQRLVAVPPVYIVAGLCLVQAQIVLSALRWRFTAVRLGQTLKRRDAIGDYYLSSFLNQTLPGGMAGDAVRAIKHRGTGRGAWKIPALAVFLERAAGQVIFLLLAGAGVIAWPLLDTDNLPPEISRLLTIVSLTTACAVVSGLLMLRFPPQALAERARVFKGAVTTVFLHAGAWRVQLALSLLIVGSYLAMYMLASAAVGAPLPLMAAVTAIPLCLLMMLIPLTVAGWGAREAASALLWPLFGFASADGVAASIFYGVLSLVGAAPGLAVAVLAFAPRNRAKQEDHAVSSRA